MLLRTAYSFVPDLVRLPRVVRRFMVLAADIGTCCTAVWIAFWLRLGEWDWVNGPLLTFMALAVTCWFGASLLGGTYKSVVRFSGRNTIYRLIPVFAGMSAALAALLFTLHIPGVPRTLSVLHPLVFFFGAATMRVLVASLIWEAIHHRARVPHRKRVLVYGAGSAGQQLAQSMKRESSIEHVGFIDDAKCLGGQWVEGKKIWHASKLERIVVREDVCEIYLAMPSAPRSAKRAIIERLKHVAPDIRVRALPSLSQIAFDHVSFSDLREVPVEELLGRDEVAPRADLLRKDIAGKIVLVTGAGGSIGSELARQILAQRPERLILADQSEHALYLIDAELEEIRTREALDTEIIADLTDVADRRDCRRLFTLWRPHTVFHAAAYKHVPMVEANRSAGIHNNVFGTLNAALSAEAVGTSKFVLVSTDKAVRPTNLMGATKRVCELIVQARADAQSQTNFTAVRFGNVLGSSGSVVPKFRAQIVAGGPITITHRDVTRYFMTIPEAAQLVIQAGAMAAGGEVFLLDMGQSVRIIDLAKAMIGLSGLTVRDESNPDGDIGIEEVGLRPGEKLYEELLISADSTTTDHPRIVMAREDRFDWTYLSTMLDRILQAIALADERTAVHHVKELVPGYGPAATPQTANMTNVVRLVAAS